MIWTFAIIAVLLVVAELVYFRVAERCHIYDKADGKVVLRGGGIIFALGMWLYAAFFGLTYWPFLVGLTLVAGISFMDDIHSLSNAVRLLVQFVAMLFVFYGWGILRGDLWWAIIPLLIVCVGATNVYNFMDGINGINGGYTFAVLLPLAWLNRSSAFVDQRLIVVALLADAVFCFFNYRPKGRAKCFAGDVGSVGAAFIVIFVLGRLIIQTGDLTYMLFLVVYGVDACLTICHRILLHERLGQAHRKHAYQLMSNELGMEHTTVATLYSLLQLAISVGLLLLPPSWHWGYFAIVCLVLCAGYLVFMKKFYWMHEEG